MIVENKTVWAAVADSMSYSKARLELFREVGNELAINNDWATTPSMPSSQMTSNATAGPTIRRVKQLTKIAFVNIVFI